MRRISLRVKFIAVILTILLVIFVIISALLLHLSMVQQVKDLNRESTAFATLATQPIGNSVQLYQSSGAIRIKQEVDRFVALDSNVSNIKVLSANGQATYTYNDQPVGSYNESDATSFNAVQKTDRNGQITQIIEPYLDDTGAHPFNILYSFSGSELASASRSDAVAIILFGCLILLASALALYLLINRIILNPIERLRDLAGVIASGNYNQTIALHSHDEIAELATSVNQMANSLKADIAKLEEVDKLKDEFIMITSHNLRTPLTIIRGSVSVLQNSNLEPQLSKMISGIESSTKELNNFAEQMLVISEIEGGSKLAHRGSVGLGDLLEPLRDESSRAAEAKQLDFQLDITNPNVYVQANKHSLSTAIRNIIDNAIKFTEKGGITVTGSSDGSHAVITVTDTGIGIKEDEMDKLFTKFHRGTGTLTYNYEGTGIGLYAAKLIVDLHGGTINAKSHEGSGSTFTIRLPLAPATKH